MKTIGIDIGTTTISGVVFDTESDRLVKSKTISGGRFISSPDEFEKAQDITGIIDLAKGLLDEFLDEYGTECIGAIGLTGQMHGILYTDENGNAISPLYTWQDQRGNVKNSDGVSTVDLILKEALDKNIITEETRWDLPLASGYGLVTHIYNLKSNRMPKEAHTILTVPDYFGMVLTGRKKPLVHPQMAASMGLFNPRTGRFFTEFLEGLGADTSILPEVTPDIASLGTYKEIPVMVALGDNQAAFLGSVGNKKEVTLLNMGTGGQISLISDSYFTGPGIEARPFLDGKFLLSGSSLCGGRAYVILERFVREIVNAAGVDLDSCYDLLEKFGKEGANSDDTPSVMTTFSGTRVSPNQSGLIDNLNETNFTPYGLTYGLLKGMAKELYDFYQIISKEVPVKTNKLVASGNGLRKNKLLRDIFGELFNAPVELSLYEEEAATGAARISAEISF